MKPAASLRASADIFNSIGENFSADFCRNMAFHAADHPALYQHWARQMAQRAADKLQQFNAKDVA